MKALKNVSFRLRPGEKMAIIGRTGSGKTTIADLLVRMYDVSGGRILIEQVASVPAKKGDGRGPR